MSYFHAVIWLDHNKAHIIHFDRERHEVHNVKHHGGERHLHHRRGSGGSGHAPEDPKYYADIIAALGNAEELLITGPANAKLELVKHIHKAFPHLVERLVGVETLDHPSDGALLKFARSYFEAADLLRPGTGVAG